MASTSTLQQPPDTGDWRDGLVVLSPDHVYGATALTAEEWKALDSRPHGEFLLSERTVHRNAPVSYVMYDDRSQASQALSYYARLTPEAFVPGGPLRIVVTEVRR